MPFVRECINQCCLQGYIYLLDVLFIHIINWISLCHAFLSVESILTVSLYVCVWKIFERILFIWAIRHPASGYVQGINDLVTPFFVVYVFEYIGKRRVLYPVCDTPLMWDRWQRINLGTPQDGLSFLSFLEKCASLLPVCLCCVIFLQIHTEINLIYHRQICGITCPPLLLLPNLSRLVNVYLQGILSGCLWIKLPYCFGLWLFSYCSSPPLEICCFVLFQFEKAIKGFSKKFSSFLVFCFMIIKGEVSTQKMGPRVVTAAPAAPLDVCMYACLFGFGSFFLHPNHTMFVCFLYAIFGSFRLFFWKPFKIEPLSGNQNALWTSSHTADWLRSQRYN